MKSPVFVVGCSRSGTTIVHSCLAQSNSFVTFPETGLPWEFCDGVMYRKYGVVAGPRKTIRGTFGCALNSAGYFLSNPSLKIKNYLNSSGREDLVTIVPDSMRSVTEALDVLRQIFDEMTKGKRWVEKTPQNIFCIDILDKYLSDVYIVHIVRDGRENIASLIDAARKYDAFAGRFGGSEGLKKAVAYWNCAVRQSAQYLNQRRHFVIRYEDLVKNPETVVSQICEFVDTPYHRNMLHYNASNVALSNEVWKFDQPPSIAPKAKKFDTVFTVEEKEYVKRYALDLDQIVPKQLGR